MNRYVIKPAKCGAADSKYFSNPGQFDKDVEINKAESEEFKKRVRNLLLEEPTKVKQRYHEAIDALISLKSEFGL